MSFQPLPFAFFFFFVFLSSHFSPALCIDFLVGDEDGWAVPKPKEADKYNKWASHNRFNVDDTVHFKYEKDSVMMVKEEEEYKECVSSKPLFYENNGDSVVKLDRAGLFYFISGVSGHCQKGQRMIIKVLEPMSPPEPPNAPPQDKSDAAVVAHFVSCSMLGMFFMLFFLLFLSI